MMKTATVYCTNPAHGQQNFYVAVDGRSYFLCAQPFRTHVYRFYENGVMLDKALDCSQTRTKQILHTMEKLPKYIRYIEKEHDLSVFHKSAKRSSRAKAREYDLEDYA